MMAAKCGADTVTACEVRKENLEIFFKVLLMQEDLV